MGIIRIESKSTRMVAHRGLSGLEMENTVAAFVAAGNRSYWGVETDTHRTSDGHFVVIHDENTERVAAGLSLSVEESTLAELQAITLTDKHTGEARSDLRIPTLHEYLTVCKKYGKASVLELKSEFTQEELERIVEEIRAVGILDQVTFISFHPENMLGIRRLLPTQPAQQLCVDMTEEIFAFIKENHLDLDVCHCNLTKEWVDRVHEAGLLVNCWTVDDPEVAERLVSWGVDFLTSNILE